MHDAPKKVHERRIKLSFHGQYHDYIISGGRLHHQYWLQYNRRFRMFFLLDILLRSI
jgi:hypothetical protein